MREKVLPYKYKEMTEFSVAVQRLVVIVPTEEQTQFEEKDTLDTENKTEMSDEQQDYGNMTSRPKELRRSRRLKGDQPESFLAALGHGLVPRPWKLPDRPAASYSLYPGASPLLVPSWFTEIAE